jgi:hypothetical protein
MSKRIDDAVTFLRWKAYTNDEILAILKELKIVLPHRVTTKIIYRDLPRTKGGMVNGVTAKGFA